MARASAAAAKSQPAVEEKKPKGAPKSIADALTQAGYNAGRVSTTVIEPEALTLIRDPAHPLYDPRVEWPVDPEDPFYKDILANGVHDPVKVRRNGVDAQQRPILQVVDGRQRVQTLMHINKHHPTPDGKPRRLKVEFVEGDDGAMVLLALSTNHQRKDETPFSRAVKIQKARAHNRTPEEIAQACRWRDTEQVEKHLLILSFIPEVQQAFNGKLPAGSIADFAMVPREEQAAVLAKVVSSGAKTKLQVAAAVNAARTGTEYVAPEKPAKMWSHGRVDLLRQKVKGRREALAGNQALATSESIGQLEACEALLAFLTGDAKALDNHPHLLAAVAEVAQVG